MGDAIFNSMEIDMLGEILNISLGASATSASNMLSRRVEITTPEVEVVSKENFQYDSLEPAIGVGVDYVEGIKGKNVMIFKRMDIKAIVEILMGGIEIPDDEFELNEMNISAVRELMNQMMGGAATCPSWRRAWARRGRGPPSWRPSSARPAARSWPPRLAAC